MPPSPPPPGYDTWIEWCLEVLLRFDYDGAWGHCVGFAKVELEALKDARPAAQIIVDPAYPKTELEIALCATLLALIGSYPGMSIYSYLRGVLFAAKPDACIQFLSIKDMAALNRVVNQIPNALIEDSREKLAWRLAHEYLCVSQAIQIGEEGKEQIATLGKNYERVRDWLPAVSTDFAPHILKAVRCYGSALQEALKDDETGQ